MSHAPPPPAKNGASALRRPGMAYVLVLAGLTFGLAAGATLLVQWALHRMEARSARARLAHPDSTERHAAAYWLQQQGEDLDGALGELLHHPVRNVRTFAADQLADRPLSDGSLHAVLGAFERERHDVSLQESAIRLCGRQAEARQGPPTDADKRMMACLYDVMQQSESGPHGRAAAALASFVHREPSLRALVLKFSERASIHDQQEIGLQLARHDPGYRAEYAEWLVKAAGGGDRDIDRSALLCLRRLGTIPRNGVAKLEALRAANPELALEVTLTLKNVQVVE